MPIPIPISTPPTPLLSQEPFATQDSMGVAPAKQQVRRVSSAAGERPSCTHPEMDRSYGYDIPCNNCFRLPRIGFVYTCLSEIKLNTTGLMNPQSTSALPTKSAGTSTRPTTPKQDAWKHVSDEFLIAFMKKLGMQKSVIDAAENGRYTREQLMKLVTLKLEVRETIKDVLAKRESLLQSRNRHAHHSSSAANGASTTLKRTLSTSEQAAADERAVCKSLNPCRFSVCHRCRPLCRDRTMGSFESVLQQDICLSGDVVETYMPVQSAAIVSKLGLRPCPPSGPSNIDPEGVESDLEDAEMTSSSSSSSAYDLSSLYRYGRTYPGDGPTQPREEVNVPTERMRSISLNIKTPPHLLPARAATVSGKPSSYGFRDTLAKDLQSLILRAYRQSQLTGRDNASGLDKGTLKRLMQLYKQKHGQVYDHALWKAMTESLLAEAASIPLPAGDDEDIEDIAAFGGLAFYKKHMTTLQNMPVDQFCAMFGFPELNDLFKDSQGTSDIPRPRLAFQPQRSVEELREAERVRGGLAVTEEALENGSPDLITSV